MAVANLRSKHRRRFSGRLLHNPVARTVAAVELSPSATGHRAVRRVDDVLHDASRDAQNARASSLRLGGRLHRGQHRGRAGRGLSGHRAGAPCAGAVVTFAVWAGVVLLGGAGAVLRFLVDRSVARRVARPFPFGTLTVNLTGAVILGLVSGLMLS